MQEEGETAEETEKLLQGAFAGYQEERKLYGAAQSHAPGPGTLPLLCGM